MAASDLRFHAAGLPDSICSALGRAVSAQVSRGIPSEPVAGDVLFFALDARGLEIGGGNSFRACLELKRSRSAAKVFFVLDAADVTSANIARFCLADGVVKMDASGELDNAEGVLALIDPEHRDVPVDAILAKLEDRIQAKAAAAEQAEDEADVSIFQQIAEGHVEDSFLGRLTDPETGLFDGPFAAFKLDEEFKRAIRFHQPLSLILLDCGGELPEDSLDRRTVLAEMASIFLNECRDIDTLARFTEHVFLFLLPGTGVDGAATVARRMLDGLKQREFAVPVRLDAIAGLATVPHAEVHDRSDFLARCESALEQARSDAAWNGLCAPV